MTKRSLPWLGMGHRKAVWPSWTNRRVPTDGPADGKQSDPLPAAGVCRRNAFFKQPAHAAHSSTPRAPTTQAKAGTRKRDTNTRGRGEKGGKKTRITTLPFPVSTMPEDRESGRAGTIATSTRTSSGDAASMAEQTITKTNVTSSATGCMRALVDTHSSMRREISIQIVCTGKRDSRTTHKSAGKSNFRPGSGGDEARNPTGQARPPHNKASLPKAGRYGEANC